MTGKNFKKPVKEKDPVEAFLSPALLDIETNTEEKDETRSKRFNLVLRPSLHKQMKKVAYMEHRSTSNLVEVAIEQYIKDRETLIYQYDLQELSRKK